MNKANKWDFGIGTTSRVPGHPNLHYLILDFDGNVPFETQFAMSLFVAMVGYPPVVQKTPHGWHFYTCWKGTLAQVIEAAQRCKADPEWIRIGQQRGYLFLADKDYVSLPWPVERMVIRDEPKPDTARNAGNKLPDLQS